MSVWTYRYYAQEPCISFYHYRDEDTYFLVKMSEEHRIDEDDIPKRMHDLICVMDAGADETGWFDGSPDMERGQGSLWAYYEFRSYYDEEYEHLIGGSSHE